MTLFRNLKDHPLVHTFLTVKGNPRLCLYTEPLWIVPFNLYMPFVSVYMAALLLSDQQIGIIASVFMLSRAIVAIFSGALVDKFGRKLTTFVFDVLSWSIPTLLWALSQNFWWFVVAAAFNGIMQGSDVSWMCLLIEDAEKAILAKVFALLHMIAQIGVIFAPLAALLVSQLSLIPAMRILYAFTFVSMTVKFIILYKYCDETEVGKTRMEETKGMSIWQIMGGYLQIFKNIFTSPDMILSLALTAIFSITGMVYTSFFGLYVTGTLYIPDYLLAYFPIIRSLTIALSLFFLSPRLERFGFKNPVLIGLSFFIAGLVLLISSPTEVLYVLIVSIILDAIGFSFVMPRIDSLIQILIEPSERARIRGLMMVIVLVLTIPFGYIAGRLSEQDRRYPFILIICLLVITFITISISKKRLEALHKQQV